MGALACAVSAGCQSVNDVSEFVISSALPDAGSDGAECALGAVRSCGSGPCFGRQTCLAEDDGSAAWGACEPPRFAEFAPPELVTGLDLDEPLWGPALSGDGGTLLFGMGAPEDLFAAVRTTPGAAFGASERLPLPPPEGDRGTPHVSSDGLRLYFYAVQSGGAGGRDLWVAARSSTSSEFDTPSLLSGVNGAADEQNPWLTADERTLFFDSTRDGGEGEQDLWIAWRPSLDAPFDTPDNVAELNTSGYEQGPTLGPGGLELIFASTRPGGQGDLDLWSATRSSTNADFSTPRNLSVLNSSGLDLDPALSADGSELFFSSSRGGAQRLYRSVRSCR